MFKCIEAGKDWSMVGKNDNLKYILAQQEFEEQYYWNPIVQNVPLLESPLNCNNSATA
jgi:hypothetical protein